MKQPKILWKEWTPSIHRSGPTLWQHRCGHCYGGPHGPKDARKLAKFLIKYADWYDFHEEKRKRKKKELDEYYKLIVDKESLRKK